MTANAGRETRKKRRLSPRLLLGLSTLALVFAVLASVSLLLRPRKQIRTLSDGTKVTLEAVTFGIEHEMHPGAWWDRLLNRQAVVFTTGPVSSSRMVTPPDSVVFWLDRPMAPVTGPTTGYGVVTDEHGCWFEPSSERWRISRSANGMARLHEIGFTAFPRRDHTMRLGLYDSYGRGPGASFRVPNPAMPSAAYRDEAPRAPVIVRSGGLEFTLQRLTHRQVNLRGRVAGKFCVTRAGRTQSAWWPRLVTVRDATGNKAVTPIRCARLADGTVRFAGLCRQEPAWKVEVEFQRTTPSDNPEVRAVEFLVHP